MKHATAVIGASYGDEGKGLAVDWLCRKGNAGVVVRFNGGAQAGHTVLSPDGRRHVFRQLGAGGFAGVPTFLSHFVAVNPVAILLELQRLQTLGVEAEVFASPECPITTPADMLINRRLEERRGSGRHGSCGMGIGETFERSRIAELSITMADLYSGVNLESKLAEICDRYARFRTGEPVDDPKMADAFLRACRALPEVVSPAGIAECEDPIFEGTQGLCLDQDCQECFPHVTRSRTGLHNVRQLCARAGIDALTTWYVSRTYLTRHGAGPLPGEDPTLSFEDETNGENAWQGRLRFAPLDERALRARIAKDAQGSPALLLLTHRDQLERSDVSSDASSWGPSASEIVMQ